MTVSDLLTAPVLAWVPTCTLVVLLAHRPWTQYQPEGSVAQMLGCAYQLLLVLGILIAPIAADWRFWAIISSVQFLWISRAYVLADNHRYLEAYWSTAICIATFVGGPAGNAYLQREALLMIGTCFALASLWKLLSTRFRNGTFFTYTLLVDSRFLPMALSVGLLTPQIHAKHVEAIGRLRNGTSSLERVPVPARLRHLALCLTWWTVAIEVAVALVFLAPSPYLGPWRALALVIFAATTFLLVPIPTFGLMLLILLATSADSAIIRGAALLLASLVWLAPPVLRAIQRSAIKRLKSVASAQHAPQRSADTASDSLRDRPQHASTHS